MVVDFHPFQSELSLQELAKEPAQRLAHPQTHFIPSMNGESRAWFSQRRQTTGATLEPMNHSLAQTLGKARIPLAVG